ncbi:MAG: glycerophosphodiester phosphodiesterase [Acidobacteria bacterium]|nr:glycerophosphodiester phosphodiesterase [Acidobacteriota bacterium]MDW7983935.1 glycerophosphodiester phosphodiesterase [Acidobacteriota bacterium]
MRVIAHRGFSGRYAENTEPAFRAALAVGADAVECDIQCTVDGVWVLFHDRSLRRKVGLSGRVPDRRWADLQGRLVRVRRRTPAPLMTLMDLAERLPPTEIFVEVKVLPGRPYDESQIRGLTYILRGHPEHAWRVITADQPTLERLHRLAPEIPRGLVLFPWASTEEIAQAGDWEYLFVHRRLHRCLPAWVRAGRRIVYYTINRPSDLKPYQTNRLYGIETDWPDRFRQARRGTTGRKRSEGGPAGVGMDRSN